MRTFKIFALTAGAALVSASAMAQTPSPEAMLKLSQYNYSFGTARSAALGGAFTSLGADLASMAINPAGLGMYQSSDVGFSPSVTSSTMKSNYGGFSASDSKTQFSVGNLAAAFNLYQGSGALTSMTFGIGYSKLADFNNTSFAYNQGIGSSITEIFAERMNGVPVSIFNTDDPYRPFRQSLRIDQWGGGLAYQAHLLEPINDKQYSPFGPSAQYPDRKGALSETATVNPAMRRITTGSIGEYDFSGGFNFNNILYVGLTIGVQDVYLRSENNYTETYNNNEYNLQRMNYVQRQRLSGTGVNFKFGAIVRPVPNLRIGVAVHTPTFISMEEEYIELLGADYKGTSPQGLIDSPFAINNYNINTPTRLLTGISYTLPKGGLISVDYERVWYNGMRLRNTGYWNVEEDTKNMIGDMYKAANNFRAGLELTPLQNFYLRAGYASYGDCSKTNVYSTSANYPTIKSYQNYSAGLGYRFGHAYLDLTYIYTDYKYLGDDIFYYNEAGMQFPIQPGTIDYQQNRHTVTLTMGVRF